MESAPGGPGSVGPRPRVGAVAIGRNEGARLERCLRSLVGQVETVVYVDSGSEDGSPEMARALGVTVVDLDLTRPFTAARARNAGARRLREVRPEVTHLQFVDGDCEVQPGWIGEAVAAFSAPDAARLAVVCGRRRERHPEASVFNRLCDVEWDTPVGDALFCGGDAMVRADAFDEVGGYRDDLIAGEEPELCVRLRMKGWRIRRIDAEMTLHDADMHRVGQWWKRTERAGYAYAAGAWLHGRGPTRHFVDRHRRIWFWGAALPAAALGAAPVTLGTSLSLLGAYPVSAARAYRDARNRGRTPTDAGTFALATTAGKGPELVGAARFHWERLRGREARLIEYKGPATPRPADRRRL